MLWSLRFNWLLFQAAILRRMISALEKILRNPVGSPQEISPVPRPRSISYQTLDGLDRRSSEALLTTPAQSTTPQGSGDMMLDQGSQPSQGCFCKVKGCPEKAHGVDIERSHDKDGTPIYVVSYTCDAGHRFTTDYESEIPPRKVAA